MAQFSHIFQIANFSAEPLFSTLKGKKVNTYICKTFLNQQRLINKKRRLSQIRAYRPFVHNRKFLLTISIFHLLFQLHINHKSNEGPECSAENLIWSKQSVASKSLN